MSAAIMRLAGDRLASFTCIFAAADRSWYEVIGIKGVLRMDRAYETVGDLKCESPKGRMHKSTYKKRDQLGPELVVRLRRTRWIGGDCVEISAAARHRNSAFCGNDNLPRL